MDKKISKLRKDLKDGCIGSFYASNSFLRIYPIFAIDKVKLSFVGIEKYKGKVADVYMDILSFVGICNLVKSGALFKAILADKSPYPSVCKYVTGKDGCKEIAFGKGQKEGTIVIQGRDKTKNVSLLVPVIWKDFQNMVFLFDIVTGLNRTSGYFDFLRCEFEKYTRENRNKFNSNSSSDEDEEVKISGEKQAAQKNTESKPVPRSETKSEKDIPKEEVLFQAQSEALPLRDGERYAVKVITSEGMEGVLLLPKKLEESQKWKTFIGHCKKNGKFSLTVSETVKDQKIFYSYVSGIF